MPPKRSSKSPKGMAKPRTPVTSSRGSGTSPAADPAEGYVKNIEDEEREASEDDEPQVFFEGSVERDANAFLNRVELLNGHSSGDPYFSPSVRKDFVEMYSGLNDHGYNQEDQSAVAELLRAGVSLQNLKDTLPALGRSSGSSGLSQRGHGGNSFHSAAEDWQAWNESHHPPPHSSPYNPPQRSLPYDHEDAMASHNAMQMFLGQPSTARSLSSSGGSVSSMQHRGSSASSQTQTDASSSQSFWASGPKPHGGGNGKGKGYGYSWN